MNVLQEVALFWKETWIEDKALFFAEAIGTVVGITANLILNIFAASAATYLPLVLLLYVISSVLIAWGAYKRRSASVLVLMFVYTIISGVGLINIIL